MICSIRSCAPNGVIAAYTPNVMISTQSGYPSSGGGSGVLTRIAQTVTSGSQTSITFSGIAGTYTNLIVTFRARTSASVDTAGLCVIFNGDSTAADYPNGNNLVFNGGQGSGNCSTLGAFLSNVPGTSAAASYPGQGTMTIEGYADTAFYKMFHEEGNYTQQSGCTACGLLSAGGWLSTSAITSLTFTMIFR